MGGPGSGGQNRLSVEEHLRRGTYRPSRHGPRPQKVLALPGTRTEAPASPDALQAAGKKLWERAWSASWIQTSDTPAVLLACQAADDVAIARERYRATGDPVDGRVLATLTKLEASMLAALGLSPVARARMGVQEVTARSKLEALRRKPSG